VSIGEPFQLQLPVRMTSEQRQEYADLVMIRIAEMLPESYRGVYAGLAAPSRATATTRATVAQVGG